jgi:deazaflavin-dependent oxidoreductase (nitroreductase family)
MKGVSDDQMRGSLQTLGSGVKTRIIHPVQKSVVNPLVRLAFRLGIPDPGDALLETTGRRTGQRRHTPVCDGLEGNTFWLLSQRGRAADWVRNIEADPRVRVKVRTGSRGAWRSGTAHILDEDDPRERQRILSRGNLARRLCVSTSAAMATNLLTIRIDLDSP